MMKRKCLTGKRILSLLLVSTLVITCALPAAAAEPVGDGIIPTCDEAYYAMLDYYGNLTEGSVVKSYALNGAGSITDYGTYDSLNNLTNSVPPSASEGVTTFEFGSTPPEHFYFEGKTTQPFETLPWTISMSYKLNGVPAKAEELAGKTGVVEIDLNFVPNENASSYAKNNYTLEAMAVFNQDDILSLNAKGAQVQLVGNLRMVLFLCLPGEEQHFTIEVGTNDFSFGGMTFLMVPATLSQLEQIADIAQKKDDLEDDYHKLSGSLDDLLSAMNGLTGSLRDSANGLDALNQARDTFSNGKDVLYDGTDLLKGDLTELAARLDPVEEQVQALSQLVTDSKSVLNTMTDTVVSLKSQLEDMEKALKNLENGKGDLQDLMENAVDMRDSLNRLKRELNKVGGGGSGGGTPSSQEMVKKVKAVHGAYEETDLTRFMARMLRINGTASSDEQAAQAAGQLKQLLDLSDAGMESMIPPEQAANLAAAKGLRTLYQLARTATFQTFCENLPGVSKAEAKQMNDLWIVYSSGKLEQDGTTAAPIAGSTSALRESVTAMLLRHGPADTVREPGDAGPDLLSVRVLSLDNGSSNGPEESSLDESSPAAASSEGNLDETNSAASVEGGSDETSAAASVEDSADEAVSTAAPEDTPEEAGTDGNSSIQATSAPGAIPPSESDSVGSAAIDLITGGLDDAMSSINSIKNELTRSMKNIAGPTASVLEDLEELCDRLEDIIDLLDDAEDLSSAVRQSSEKLRSVLDDTDALRSLLNNYEPTLQATLSTVGGLGVSAAATARDTVSLIDSTEDLLRRSGTQLDSGTRQALNGLAAVLRRTANVMATSGSIQSSKNAMTGIIEDLWNDHTGDVDNLLMMDATAPAESLTDPRNGTPQSVQIMIRTQEIKAEEQEEAETAARSADSSTFWGRVAQMFRDFWAAVTGIFR